MNVNSSTRVNGLNADRLDGTSADDFVSGDKTYAVREVESKIGGGAEVELPADCDPGDMILGGGAPFPSDLLRVSEPTVNGWRIVAQDNGDASTVVADATCANSPRR